MKLSTTFFSPDAAVADAPMTSIGDAYKEALAKSKADAQVEAEPAAVIAKVEPKPEATKDDAKKPDVKPVKAAPKSALDAVLNGDEKPDEVVATEDEVESFDKEFPESAKDHNFKALRGSAKKAWEQVKELRGKVGKVEVDPAIASELQTVKQQLKESENALAEREQKLSEYNDAMTAVNLELHPDFRKEFVDGRKSLLADAMGKFKAYEGNPEMLADALSIQPGKRRDDAVEELLGNLSDTAKAKILKSVADIETLDERRQKALGNSQQSYEELERKTLSQRQKQAQESEQVKASEFERIAKDVHKSTPTLGIVDEMIEGGKDWNTAVKQAREDAYKLFGQDASFPDMVTTAIKGKDYDRVTKMLISERKETAALRAQLAEYEGSSPDLTGKKAPNKSAHEANMDKTPGEIYRESLASAKGQVEF